MINRYLFSFSLIAIIAVSDCFAQTAGTTLSREKYPVAELSRVLRDFESKYCLNDWAGIATAILAPAQYSPCISDEAGAIVYYSTVSHPLGNKLLQN
jgi:hypothetical protein